MGAALLVVQEALVAVVAVVLLKLTLVEL